MVLGVKVAVGDVVLLSCDVLVLGEVPRMDQAPVPFTGVLAARGVETAEMHIVWSGPALEAVGCWFTTTANWEVLVEAPPLLQVVVAM